MPNDGNRYSIDHVFDGSNPSDSRVPHGMLWSHSINFKAKSCVECYKNRSLLHGLIRLLFDVINLSEAKSTTSEQPEVPEKID